MVKKLLSRGQKVKVISLNKKGVVMGVGMKHAIVKIGKDEKMYLHTNLEIL